MTKHRFAAVAALMLSAGLAQAQIVITTNTTIAPGDPTYQNQDIIVRGCTVTINGAQSFNSLTIERNASNAPGVVTHDATFSSGGVNGMFITIAGDLVVQGPAKGGLVASRIDVNSKGFPLGGGPGSRPTPVPDGGAGIPAPQGGSYGGAGSPGWPNAQYGQVDQYDPAPCYGSYVEPSDHGSGSAFTIQGPLPGIPFGAPGGGAVHLAVGNVATINGSISANGGASTAGGSGGSVWISAAELAGAGSISAHGGTDVPTALGGGGGGGRVAIHTETLSFSGTILACGGTPSGSINPGGAGTVFYRVTGQNDTLVFDNSNIRPDLSPYTATLSGDVTINADVILRNRGRLNARRNDSLNLTINGALTIDAMSQMGAFGTAPRPAPAGNGSFANPVTGSPTGGGGGHGGAGAAGTGGASPPFGVPGAAHGDPNNPVTVGGAGGNGMLLLGMRGGGAFHLVTNTPIVLNGQISADGVYRQGDTGAGAGGCVWIEAPAISGSGIIAARGGASNQFGTFGPGSGGGGRVRVDTCDLSLAGANILATGANPGSVVVNTTAPFASQSFSIAPFVPHETVVLTASAIGDALDYQWRRNGVNIPEGFGGGRYTGTQTMALTITDPTCADAATFDFVASNICGVSASNSAQLTSAIDWNADGTINSTDVSDFINSWFTDQAKGTTVTDINGDGVSNSTDVSDFINFWFEEEPAC